MEDLERTAFTFALKAVYFDEQRLWESAVHYYIQAGELLIQAATNGSRIPDLRPKARLYCDRAAKIATFLSSGPSGREADDDWVKVDVVDEVGIDCQALEKFDFPDDDRLTEDYVIIYFDAVQSQGDVTTEIHASEKTDDNTMTFPMTSAPSLRPTVPRPTALAV